MSLKHEIGIIKSIDNIERKDSYNVILTQLCAKLKSNKNQR